MLVKRVLVIGSCGAGKTTLARRLADITKLELIHLDRLYWGAGWVEPDKERWRASVEDLVARDSWIIDGNYGGTMELRLKYCDTVIFLDFPRFTCTWRVLKRWFKYSGENRPDMADFCAEKVDLAFLQWTWTFPERSRPHVIKRLDAVRNEKRIFTLRKPSEVEAFVDGLRFR